MSTNDTAPDDEFTALLADAASMVITTQFASTSLLQRRLGVGYAKARDIMDALADRGIVGPADGSRARDVHVAPDDVGPIVTQIRAGHVTAADQTPATERERDEQVALAIRGMDHLARHGTDPAVRTDCAHARDVLVSLTALLAEQAATIERVRVVHYSPDMRRAPIVNPASEGWDDHDWHAAGVADTGTSHVRVGRPYVVACEWCPEVFLAETAAGAMSMFRAHESQMLGQRTEGQG